MLHSSPLLQICTNRVTKKVLRQTSKKEWKKVVSLITPYHSVKNNSVIYK